MSLCEESPWSGERDRSRKKCAELAHVRPCGPASIDRRRRAAPQNRTGVRLAPRSTVVPSRVLPLPESSTGTGVSSACGAKYNRHVARSLGLAPETPLAKGKPYQRLNAEQKIMFGMRPLTIMVLENATISEVRDMFLRRQNGTPLNAREKRNATGSLLRRHVNAIANLPFFEISVNFGGEAAEHDRVAAQMLQ